LNPTIFVSLIEMGLLNLLPLTNKLKNCCNFNLFKDIKYFKNIFRGPKFYFLTTCLEFPNILILKNLKKLFVQKSIFHIFHFSSCLMGCETKSNFVTSSCKHFETDLTFCSFKKKSLFLAEKELQTAVIITSRKSRFI
jgi:hypothetical protein